MNGKIVIDGYKTGLGTEINIHGGKPEPDAVASLTMEINKNKTVREILLQMLAYVEKNIE